MSSMFFRKASQITRSNCHARELCQTGCEGGISRREEHSKHWKRRSPASAGCSACPRPDGQELRRLRQESRSQHGGGETYRNPTNQRAVEKKFEIFAEN